MNDNHFDKIIKEIAYQCNGNRDKFLYMMRHYQKFTTDLKKSEEFFKKYNYNYFIIGLGRENEPKQYKEYKKRPIFMFYVGDMNEAFAYENYQNSFIFDGDFFYDIRKIYQTVDVKIENIDDLKNILIRKEEKKVEAIMNRKEKLIINSTFIHDIKSDLGNKVFNYCKEGNGVFYSERLFYENENENKNFLKRTLYLQSVAYIEMVKSVSKEIHNELQKQERER